MDGERTHTLADLKRGEFGGTPLAVLGRPVRHSISPAMHNAAIAELRKRDSRFKDWVYHRFDVAPEDLPEALELFHRKSFLGLNLTVPHKVIAMESVCGVSVDAERMGAVNTLVWDEMGYDGFNTDGHGLSRGLEEDLGVRLKGATVILLGSGGAARAAAVRCVCEGCERLLVGNRTPARLRALLDTLAPLPGGDRVRGFAPDAPPEDLPDSGVLVNATSLGLKPGDPAPFDVGRLPAGWRVYDMIYNPARTALLEAAAARGLPAANGLSMLVHQGCRSLEIWSHEKVDARVMRVAARHALGLPPEG